MDEQELEARMEAALPAFVLGALEPDEMITVERYLRERASPALRAKLHLLEEATVQLGRSAPAAPLPPSVKERLMRRVRADLSSAAPAPTPPPAPQRRAWRLSDWLRPVAWAAAGALLALLIVFPRHQANLAASHAEGARLAQEVARLEQDNEQLRGQLSTRQQQLLAVAHSQQQVALAGTEAAPGAVGTLYLGAEEGLLVLEGLPALPPEQRYQLWWISEERGAIPSALLTVTEVELTTLVIALPEAGLRYEAVGISIEPAGGSQQPTGPVVLLGQRG